MGVHSNISMQIHSHTKFCLNLDTLKRENQLQFILSFFKFIKTEENLEIKVCNDKQTPTRVIDKAVQKVKDGANLSSSDELARSHLRVR